MELENGMELRLLSALEVLEARREAAQLAESQEERALCSNACLLARALESGEKPVFDSGRAVLAGLTVSEIAALAGRWREVGAECWVRAMRRRESGAFFLCRKSIIMVIND